MMYKHLIKPLSYTCIALSAFNFSCDQAKNTTDQPEAEENDPWKNAPVEVDKRSLDTKLLAKKDSIDMLYLLMTRADSQRIADVITIVNCIKEIEGFNDTAKSEELIAVAEQADQLRYDEMTMQQANHMDIYDQSLENMLKVLDALAKGTDKFYETDACAEVHESVLKSNDQDFYYRRDYSLVVASYNQLFTENKDAIMASENEKVKQLKLEADFNYGDEEENL